MHILALLSALGAALIAGTFFAFSAFVMAALAKLPVPQGIAAMQQVNITVINPLFMGVFVGTAILSAVIAAYAVMNWQGLSSAALLCGALLYVVGCFLLTMVANVPLNNALATVDPASGEGALLWERYLKEWTLWNHFRGAASLGACGLLFWAWGN